MPTILVVDDQRDAQITVSAKLEGMGFAVKTSETAVEIVEQVISVSADMVFMDMNMPNIDGCEAAQILRNDERTSSIPIVMLSSTTTADDREIAIQAGCVDLIAKPIDEVLVRALFSRIFNDSTNSTDVVEAAL